MFRRLLFHVAIGVAAVTMINAVVLMLHAPSPEARASYTALHRKVRMLDTISTPRVIVVGGSSVAFGQDSRLFEQELGLPVINLGTHGGIGLRYMLTNVRPFIRRGDIVILAPEHGQYFGAFEGDWPLLEMLMVNPDAIQNITSQAQLRTLAAGVARKLRNVFDPLLLSIARPVVGPKSGTRERNLQRVDTLADSPGYHGDTWNRERIRRAHPLRDWEQLDPEFLDLKALQVVAAFKSRCEDAGVDVLLGYSPVPDLYYQQNVFSLSRLHDSLTQIFREDVLLDPSQAAYPEELFLDTIYHLNAIGRVFHTRRLSKALNAWIIRNALHEERQ